MANIKNMRVAIKQQRKQIQKNERNEFAQGKDRWKMDDRREQPRSNS